MPNTLQAVLLFWILSWVRAPGSYIFLSFRRKAPLPSPQPFPEKGLQAAVANTRHVHLVILSEDYENVNYHDKIIPPRFENKWSMFWIWLKEGKKKKDSKIIWKLGWGKKNPFSDSAQMFFFLVSFFSPSPNAAYFCFQWVHKSEN